MPRRHKVEQFPESLLDEIKRRLVENGFSQFKELAAWCAEQGQPIGHGSLHRWACGPGGFKEEYEDAIADARLTRELGRLYAAEFSDADDSEMQRAAAGMQRDAVTRLTLKLRRMAGEDDADVAAIAKTLAQLTRAQGDIGRLQISQAKWAAELRRQDAAKLDAAVDAGEIDAEAAERARRILGFA